MKGEENMDKHNYLVMFISNYERVRNYLYPGATSVKNTDFLKDKVYHVVAEDIAIHYQIVLPTNASFCAVIPVTKELFSAWNIDKNKLFEDAKKLPCVCQDLNEVLVEHMESARPYIDKESLPEFEEQLHRLKEAPPDEQYVQMYVLRPEGEVDNIFGAASVLLGGAKRAESVLGTQFVLIPSSIYEMIAISINDAFLNNVNELISDVNTSKLANRDVLSDHAYLYDNGKITIF